jgi:hypothetical protein
MSLIRALDNGSISKYCWSGHHLRFIWCGAGLALMILFSSCNSKKYLSDDQSFLWDNKISFKSAHKIPNKSELSEDLVTLYRQQKTKGIIPRHYFYYKYQKSLEKNPNSKKWD